MDKKQLQVLLGLKVKSIRESKGLTQLDVASACNIEQTNLSRIETGSTNPSLYMLYTISLALDTPIHELLMFELSE